MSTTSGNTPVTKITIPTDQLRALLPEDALIEIERRAIEKIAESVKDKIAQKSQPTIELIVRDVVAKMVKEDMASETYLLSTPWKFPQAGKDIVTGLVRESTTKLVDTISKEAAGKAADGLKRELRAQMDEYQKLVLVAANNAVQARMKELDEHVSTMARTQFLAVLKEAKEAGL